MLFTLLQKIMQEFDMALPVVLFGFIAVQLSVTVLDLFYKRLLNDDDLPLAKTIYGLYLVKLLN